MAIIQAYECEQTGQLFKKKADYDRHTKALAAVQKARQERIDQQQSFKDRFTELRKKARSFDDISAWLMENAALIAAINAFRDSFSIRSLPKNQVTTLRDMEFNGMSLRDSVSNTHGCPINGVMNWGGRVQGAPRGYPGASGMIYYYSTDDIDLPDALKAFSGIYLGSGGSTSRINCNHQYSCEIYAEDWPFLGADFLFRYKGASNSELIDRIFTYAFPGMQPEMFKGLKSGGLLPTDIEAFKEYMYQFIDDTHGQNRPDAALASDTDYAPVDVPN